MKAFWNKLLQGALLVVGLVIGFGILKHNFGNQPWMTVVAGTFLAAGIAWICNKSAGVIVSVAAAACLLIAGVQMYHVWEVKDHPEVVLSEHAAAQAAQVQKIINQGGPGAAQKLAVISGTYQMDSVFAGNTTVRMDGEVKNLPAGSITYPDDVYDRMIGLADTIRQNAEKTRQIWNRLEGIPEKPKPADVTIDLTDPDGTTIVVPSGMEARLSIVHAKYVLNKVFVVDQNGTGRTIVDFESDANGQPVDDPDDRFVAPAIARYATIYKNGGDWQNLNMGETVLVSNHTGSPKEVVVTVNDIRGTYDTNKGTLVVRCELVPAPVELASTY